MWLITSMLLALGLIIHPILLQNLFGKYWLSIFLLAISYGIISSVDP